MTDLHDIQRQLVAGITAAPVGSALKFALMDAADAVGRAIEVEARGVGAQALLERDGNHPETQQSRGQMVGAELGGNRS